MAITSVISPSSLNNHQPERENVGQGQDVTKNAHYSSFQLLPTRLPFIRLQLFSGLSISVHKCFASLVRDDNSV